MPGAVMMSGRLPPVIEFDRNACYNIRG